MTDWRDALASVAGLTPSRGYVWPSDAGGRFGVRADDVRIRDLMAERDRLRAVVEAAKAYLDALDAYSALHLPAPETHAVGNRVDETWGEFESAVRQLDVSENMGGETFVGYVTDRGIGIVYRSDQTPPPVGTRLRVTVDADQPLLAGPEQGDHHGGEDDPKLGQEGDKEHGRTLHDHQLRDPFDPGPR